MKGREVISALTVLILSMLQATAAPAAGRGTGQHELEDREDPQVAWSATVMELLDQRKFGYAERIAGRAAAVAKRRFGRDSVAYATSLLQLAKVKQARSRFGESIALSQDAERIMFEIDPDHPLRVACLNHIASLYQRTGRYSDALPLYENALKILKRTLDVEHPHIDTIQNNIATLYTHMGRYDEALGLYQRLLKAQTHAPEDESLAALLNNVARLYLDLNRLGDALPLLGTVCKTSRHSDWCEA